jgi:hypothetical protein
MASAEGMVNSLFDRSSRFYSICLKNIKFYMNLLGHNFVVSRPKENSKWKNVFGGSFSSDNTLENDYEQFTTRLIINLNDMRDVWNRNRDTIESYTPDGSLNVGDELQYTRDKRTFRFKIIQKQGYSEAAEVLYTYTLSSIIETLTE